MPNPLDNARDAELVIERAIKAGIALDAGNVIDLLADNLLHLTLEECREALRVSSFRGRWPSAERVRKSVALRAAEFHVALYAAQAVVDSIDYRAMLAREIEKTKSGPQYGSICQVHVEAHLHCTFREHVERTIGHELSADDARRYCYRNVYQG